MNKHFSGNLWRGLVCVVLLTLGACGDSHHSEQAAAEPEGVPMTQVTMRVIDEAYENVRVFKDLNRNDTWDANEPFGFTDKNGFALILLTPIFLIDDSPWVAEIDTGSVDVGLLIETGNGRVSIPFKLGAPADSNVISPFTSLMQIAMEVEQLSKKVATDLVTRLAATYGITVDPLADYLQSEEQQKKVLARIARVLILIKQEIVKNVGEGPEARDAIDHRMLIVLGEVAALAGRADILAITDPAARLEALKIGAVGIALKVGLTAQNIAAIIVKLKSGDTNVPDPDPPEVPGASLHYMTFVSATNYDFGLTLQTASQKVPDANGKLYFTEQRRRAIPSDDDGSSGPVISNPFQYWGDEAYRRNRLYWSNARNDWVECAENTVQEKTPIGEDGKYEVTYCTEVKYEVQRLLEWPARRFSFDDLRTFLRGLAAVGTKYDSPFQPAAPIDWNDNLIAADAPMPDTALVILEKYRQSNQAFSSSTVDRPMLVPPDFYACTPGQVAREAASLEELLQIRAIMCSSGPFTDSFDYALLNLKPGNNGRIANTIAVSFREGSDQVDYWRCDEQSNCQSIGAGSYQIDVVGTQGDRKLAFTGLPFEVARRIFVQRGSAVYYGDAPFGIDRRSMTLNEPLTEALFEQLEPEAVSTPTR